MLTVCSSSQITYCNVGVDGALSIISRTLISSPPITNAVAWDATYSNILLPTQTALLAIDPAAKKTPATLKTWKSAPIQTLDLAGPKNTLYYCQNSKLVVVDPRGQPRALTQGEFCMNVTSIQVSKDRSYIACISSSFWFWDVFKKSRTTLEGIHNEGVGAFCFSSHQNDRIYATDKGDVLVYDLSISQFPAKRVAVGDARLPIVIPSPVQHDRIAVADTNGRIYIVDTSAECSVHKKYTQSNAITTLSWNSNGTVLYAGTPKGLIISYDLNDSSKEPVALEVGTSDQYIYTIANIPIKLKPSTPKATRVSSASEVKRLPLTDGSNLMRSVSTPNVKTKPVTNKQAIHSSPTSKRPIIKSRLSETSQGATRKSPLNPNSKTAKQKVLQKPLSKAPSTPIARRPQHAGACPASISSPPETVESTSKTTSAPSEDNRSTPSPSPSSSSRALASVSSRTSVAAPSTPDSCPGDPLLPIRRDLSVSPSLPSIAADDTIKLPAVRFRPPSPKRREKKEIGPQTDHKRALVREKGSASQPPVEAIETTSRARTRPSSLQNQLKSMPRNRTSSDEPAINDEVKQLLTLLREETRGSIMNLHLDLLRQSRDYQRNLRECMTEWQELKEENRRLRAENDWLKSL